MDVAATSPFKSSIDANMASRRRDSETAAAIDARRQKRFTLTLPIQASFPTIDSSRNDVSPVRPLITRNVVSDDSSNVFAPSDTNFLTALAAQERRVLELKEELNKAEHVLQRLKKEWAVREVQKKRQDIRRTRSVRRSNTNTPGKATEDESHAIVEEAERRRAMHYNARPSHRKVFSGSKHARALSLLSPTSDTGAFPALQPRSLNVTSPTSIMPDEMEKPIQSPRRTISGEMQRSKSHDVNNDLDNLPKDVLLRAGRQMATDFKDGLWTFLEDLRQVTVGEEQEAASHARALRLDSIAATRTQQDRRKATIQSPGRSARNRRSPARPKSAGSATDKTTQEKLDATSLPSPKDSAVDFGDNAPDPGNLIDIGAPESPVARKTPGRRRDLPQRGHQRNASKFSDIEAWDTWDSPQAPGQLLPAVEVVPTTENVHNEKNADFRGLLDDALATELKREPIPWPALAKLAPTQLRRTASHLMIEWERSLSPQPEGQAVTTRHDAKMD